MSSKANLCYSDGSNVFWITRRAVSGAPESGDDAADPLGPDTAIDGVNRRWWRTGQPRAGIVVADGLNGRGLKSISPII